MTDSMREKVSALVDGEVGNSDPSDVVAALCHDPALRTQWERHHLIRDALKKNLPDSLELNLAHRISLAIEHIDLVVPAENATQTASVSWSDRINQWMDAIVPRSRLAGATAFAASVTVALGVGIVIGAQPDSSQSLMAQTSPAPTAAVVSQAGGLTREPPAPATARLVAGEPAGQLPPAQQWAPRLDYYLNSHSEYAAQRGIQNPMMPAVRFVGYESSR